MKANFKVTLFPGARTIGKPGDTYWKPFGTSIFVMIAVSFPVLRNKLSAETDDLHPSKFPKSILGSGNDIAMERYTTVVISDESMQPLASLTMT